MLEVFYAGGTATRDFSAADIVAEIAALGTNAEFAPSREWLVARVAQEARPGDLVLVMGARDPSLSELARAILAAIDKAAAPEPAKYLALTQLPNRPEIEPKPPAVPCAALARYVPAVMESASDLPNSA